MHCRPIVRSVGFGPTSMKGVSHMLDPIIGGSNLLPRQLTFAVRDYPLAGRLVVNLPRRSLEVGQHRLHQRGMKRVGDLEPATTNSVSLEACQHATQRLGVARNHRILCAIESGD